LSEAIETTATSVSLDDDGLIHVVANGTASTAQTVKETVAAIHSLVPRPRPAIFDARRWPRAGTDVWTALIDALPTIVSAAAVLVQPEGVAWLGGFPAAVNRLMLPMEVFTDEAEALRFIRQYLPGPGEDYEEE
jgi:hypothetical protein